MADERARTELFRFTFRTDGNAGEIRRGDRVPAQADELPLPYRDLQIATQKLPRTSRPLCGARHCLSRGTFRDAPRSDARQGIHAGRCDIFATPETVEQEIGGCVDFAYDVFRTFGFEKFKIELSVRGDVKKDYLGSDADWENAEHALVNALEARKISYERIEGEAAFYGPKIDIKVEDSIGRMWQLSTVQFDFNLPERFELEYIGDDNSAHRPIMVHRALFGSVERFFGVLIEHFAGAFPFWLAPVQVTVLPITDRINEYASQVGDRLKELGFRVEVNLKSDKVGAKIRDAQMQKIPFMLVLGDKELEENTVAVREKVTGDLGTMSIDDFIKMARRLKETRALANV